MISLQKTRGGKGVSGATVHLATCQAVKSLSPVLYRCRCKVSGQEYSVRKVLLEDDRRAALSTHRLCAREAKVLRETKRLPRVPSLIASLPSGNGLQLCVVTE